MSGIPYYKKASGAKRRAEQHRKEQSEKELLLKMPKISDMLKTSSLTSQSAAVVPELHDSISESDADIPCASGSVSSMSTRSVLSMPTTSSDPSMPIGPCIHDMDSVTSEAKVGNNRDTIP